MEIRNAVEEDSADLLRWRNDPHTRAMSITTEPVSQQGHDRWYAAALKATGRRILIGSQGDAKVGMIRFDRISDRVQEVSICVAPEMRGKGFGSKLLGVGIHLAMGGGGFEAGQKLRAQIKPKNEVSLRTFKAHGFIQTGEAEGLLIFEM